MTAVSHTRDSPLCVVGGFAVLGFHDVNRNFDLHVFSRASLLEFRVKWRLSMTFVGNAKFKGATGHKCIIQFEVDVEFDTGITHKIIMIRFP